MQENLTIGQLADIFKINIQTLYFYDKKGVLVPSSRDLRTGIRTYSFKQVQQLSTILYLKRCGFSLDEIKETMTDLTPERAREKLIEKSDKIMNQWRKIIKLDTILRSKLDYIDEELEKRPKEEGKVLFRKKRHYLQVGEEETAYGTEYLSYYPLVVCYFPSQKVFGALDDSHEFTLSESGTVAEIPEGSYLIEYHKGPYTTIRDHQKKIMDSNVDLKFTRNIYTFDIVDQMNCNDINEFITKMEFQLEK